MFYSKIIFDKLKETSWKRIRMTIIQIQDICVLLFLVHVLEYFWVSLHLVGGSQGESSRDWLFSTLAAPLTLQSPQAGQNNVNKSSSLPFFHLIRPLLWIKPNPPNNPTQFQMLTEKPSSDCQWATDDWGQAMSPSLPCLL